MFGFLDLLLLGFFPFSLFFPCHEVGKRLLSLVLPHQGQAIGLSFLFGFFFSLFSFIGPWSLTTRVCVLDLEVVEGMWLCFLIVRMILDCMAFAPQDYIATSTGLHFQEPMLRDLLRLLRLCSICFFEAAFVHLGFLFSLVACLSIVKFFYDFSISIVVLALVAFGSVGILSVCLTLGFLKRWKAIFGCDDSFSRFGYWADVGLSLGFLGYGLYTLSL